MVEGRMDRRSSPFKRRWGGERKWLETESLPNALGLNLGLLCVNVSVKLTI